MTVAQSPVYFYYKTGWVKVKQRNVDIRLPSGQMRNYGRRIRQYRSHWSVFLAIKPLFLAKGNQAKAVIKNKLTQAAANKWESK